MPATATTLELEVDLAFADFLLQQELQPDLQPERFAAALPVSWRQSFLELAALSALAAPLRPQPLPGQLRPLMLGELMLGTELGRGAAGTVHAATLSGRPVAVKRCVAPTAAAAALLEDEAATLAACAHPAIAVLVWHGVVEGVSALVMAQAAGQSLHRWLAQAAVGDAVARSLFADPARIAMRFAALADGLAHVHARGFVHRDLKPANLVADVDGNLVLVDFGLATRIASNGKGTNCVGTPLYMAPEQLAGEAVGPATDVFAFGCVLQEVLTGKPARGPNATLLGVPAGLRRIVRRCTAMAPSRRFPSAGEAAMELRAFAGRAGERRKRPVSRSVASRGPRAHADTRQVLRLVREPREPAAALRAERCSDVRCAVTSAERISPHRPRTATRARA